MKPISNQTQIKSTQQVYNQEVRTQSNTKAKAATAYVTGSFAALINSFNASKVAPVAPVSDDTQTQKQEELNLIGQLAYIHSIMKKIRDYNAGSPEWNILQAEINNVLKKADAYANSLQNVNEAKPFLEMLTKMKAAQAQESNTDYNYIEQLWTGKDGYGAQVINWYGDNASAIKKILSTNPDSDLKTNQSYLDSVAALFFITSSEYNNPNYAALQKTLNDSIFSSVDFQLQIGQFMTYYFYKENGNSMSGAAAELSNLLTVITPNKPSTPPSAYDNIITILQHTDEEAKTFGNNWPDSAQIAAENAKGAGYPIWSPMSEEMNYDFFFLGNVFQKFFS